MLLAGDLPYSAFMPRSLDQRSLLFVFETEGKVRLILNGKTGLSLVLAVVAIAANLMTPVIVNADATDSPSQGRDTASLSPETPVPLPFQQPVSHPVPVVKKGINYLSQWVWYKRDATTDEILRRDFAHFRADGIEYISLPLYWCRLEGNTRGDYTGADSYGDAFLANTKRVIDIAGEYDIGVMVSISTQWGPEGTWSTPDYVIDPVTGRNEALAVARSQDMQDAFVEMFTHTVAYLKGSPNIWSWALNEPWYYPRTLPAPFEDVDQKENFIRLFQRMNAVVKSLDGRPFTVKFPSVHNEPQYVTDVFADNWGYDQRMLDIVDFVSFTTYLPDNAALIAEWRNIVAGNVAGCVSRGKQVWISEFGTDKQGSEGVEIYRTMLSHLHTLPVQGIFPWMWRGDSAVPNPEPPGTGYNICADPITGSGTEAYQRVCRDGLPITVQW